MQIMRHVGILLHGGENSQ